MLNALAVAAGGALGSLARWGVSEWSLSRVGPGFPWGTLAVNLTGSLLVGVAWGLLGPASAEAPSAGATPARLLLIVGFLGAFTTFSTFSHETVLMVQQGHGARAAGYVTASIVGGLLFALVGLALASGAARMGLRG